VSDWASFATDAYLDHRHRNWVLSEEMGDVRFQPATGVVLVHRVRAEHIVRELSAHPAAVRVKTVTAAPARSPAAPARAVRGHSPTPGGGPSRAARVQAAPTLRITTSPACVLAHASRLADPPPPRAITAAERRRVLGGWLGLVMGTALLVAALTIRLDDAALLLALALLLRGGCRILDVDS
jgi:hypothetical protein